MTSIARLDENAVAESLQGLEGWTLEGNEIARSFEFANFQEAFAFLTRVALLSEQQDHHPEIWNVWNKVSLKLTTHDADGLTARDMKLAASINQVLA